jgi:hypothetical protein
MKIRIKNIKQLPKAGFGGSETLRQIGQSVLDIKQDVDWDKIANLTTSGISMWANEANKNKNNRMLKQAKMNQLFNQNIMPGGNKGMFDINTGMPMFDNVNAGMYSNAFYTPQQSMAYGGQTNYALDIKRDYNVDGKQPYEELSGTLQPVDRRLANVEAEKGETVYGDLDGDGGFEHMKIGGNRHHSGGTPLNLPEDSFIYSDTKKMKIKDPEALAFFGLKIKSGGYTPAEIAKKYDVNKYKAMMEDPNADDLDKSTAQLMVNNYQDKLSRLALIQEEMKGFPQGIPKVAEEYAIKKGLVQSPEEMEEDEYEEEMVEEPMMRFGGNLPKAQFAGQFNA